MKFTKFINRRKKLQGTVGLLKQSLLGIITIAIIGLLVAYMLDYALGLIAFGVSIFAVGGIIVTFRRIIWDDYVKSHRVRSGLLAKLSQPTKLAYWLNVGLVWPLVMAIGVAAIFAGLTAS